MSNNTMFAHMGGPIYDVGMPNNPAPIEDAGWYFWDETWANYHGPFATREECSESLDRYCKEYL